MHSQNSKTAPSKHLMALRPPPDSLPYAQYLPLTSLLIPFVGSSIHGTFSGWQHFLVCGLLLVLLLNTLKLPWQLLSASQLAQLHPLPSSTNPPPPRLPKPAHSAFKRHLRLLELLALAALLASPFISVALLRLIHSTLNPSSRPVGKLLVRLVFLASAFKPAGYLLGLLRAGTPFGIRSRPPPPVSVTHAYLAELVGDYANLAGRTSSLSDKLASDPELESLRADTERSLSQVTQQLTRRANMLDRLLESESVQMSALLGRMGRMRNATVLLVAETKRLMFEAAQEHGWLWDWITISVGKIVDIEQGRRKLVGWLWPPVTDLPTSPIHSRMIGDQKVGRVLIRSRNVH